MIPPRTSGASGVTVAAILAVLLALVLVFVFVQRADEAPPDGRAPAPEGPAPEGSAPGEGPATPGGADSAPIRPGSEGAQQAEDAELEGLLESERNAVEVAASVGSGVVAVDVLLDGRGILPPALGGGTPQVPIGTGSGFLIDDRGAVITNLHVIADALRPETAEILDGAEVTVSFPGLERSLGTRVVGIEPETDLALLRLVDPDAVPEGAHVFALADSDDVQVGQTAIVIGNPFRLETTVTVGAVSAVEREAPGAFGVDLPFLQLDAALNPGSSGGPVLDSSGRVIGIANAILTPTGTFAGVGLAVPANLLADNLDELQASER